MVVPVISCQGVAGGGGGFKLALTNQKYASILTFRNMNNNNNFVKYVYPNRNITWGSINFAQVQFNF